MIIPIPSHATAPDQADADASGAVLALDLGTTTFAPSVEWRPIPDWPDYEVSAWGDIRRITPSRSARAGAVLAPFFRSNGYAQVILYSNGAGRRFLVHRLVALAFHGRRPSPSHEVAHLSGTRSNNHYQNLRWVTHRENEAHKDQHGTRLRGSAVGNARLNESDVVRIKSALTAGRRQSEIAREFHVSQSTVYLIANGKTWRHVQ
jgi:hypothetical protein